MKDRIVYPTVVAVTSCLEWHMYQRPGLCSLKRSDTVKRGIFAATGTSGKVFLFLSSQIFKSVPDSGVVRRRCWPSCSIYLNDLPFKVEIALIRTDFSYAALPSAGLSAGVRISGFIRQIIELCRRAMLIKQMIMEQLCWSHAVSVICLCRTTVMKASVSGCFGQVTEKPNAMEKHRLLHILYFEWLVGLCFNLIQNTNGCKSQSSTHPVPLMCFLLNI